jgi:prefoldin subunit 5
MWVVWFCSVKLVFFVGSRVNPNLFSKRCQTWMRRSNPATPTSSVRLSISTGVLSDRYKCVKSIMNSGDLTIHRKAREYAAFLESTLRPDHALAVAKADEIRAEMDEYQNLQQRLLLLSASGSPSTTTEDATMFVDLGFGVLSCEAVIVPTPSNKKNENGTVDSSTTIFVHVGMGFHVELTPDEAQKAIRRRLEYLQAVYKARQAAADAIKKHILSTEEILDELARLNRISY